MAKFNLDYYNNEDLYSDGDIENEMLRLADMDDVMEHINPTETDFAVLYHFSPVRENILNWYPFKEDATILEIGAGCGAITGALCNKANKVIAVELSKRRAEINYRRHRNCDNLEIMVGNFNDMHFGQQFDYIVLNGVFEYAISFTEGNTPYESFLRNMVDFLKPDGRILIAIENRLGLKYFAGAPEDHTELFFLGQNNYFNYDKVKTFSKEELIDIFESCGLLQYKFYYPYPDYKFPKEIFTDASIQSQHYGKPSVNLSNNKIHLFNENVVAETFIKEGVMDVFANSFLVEVGKSELENGEEIEYVKLNMDRNPEFRIATIIEEKDNERIVIKKALTEAAEAHIDKLLTNQGKAIIEGYFNLPGKKGRDGEIIYPYLELSNIDDEICTLIEKKDKLGIFHKIQNIFEKYYESAYEDSSFYSERFIEVFGNEKREKKYHCLKTSNVDLICDNVFVDGEKHYIIDCEWIFDFPIPLEFIIWRAINELYSKHIKLYDVIEKNEFMHLFNIDKKDERLFFSWSYHFAYEYVGSDSLNEFAKDEKHIALDEIVRDINRKESRLAYLYYDTGEGFVEEQKLEAHMEMCDGMFNVQYDISGIDNIINLRWDPIEFNYCICKVEFDSALLECSFSNALVSTEEGDLFATSDPNYSFVLKNDKTKTICFTGKLRVLEADEVLEKASSLYREKCRAVDEHMEINAIKTQEVKRLEHDLGEANQINNILLNSFSWRVTAPVRKVGRLLRKGKNCIVKKVENDRTEQKELPLLDLVRYSIDKAEFDDGILHIQGWLFCESHKIQTARLELISAQGDIIGDTVSLQRRDDVKLVFEVEFEGNCGFNFIVKYESDVERKLCFLLEIDNQEVLLETDRVVPATGEKESKLRYIRELESDVEYQEFYRRFVTTCDMKFTEEYLNTTIDIVIPVYNGYEFLQKLFTSISQTKMRYRLLIVEDCSTDLRVRPFLKEYATTHDNVILLLNDENMGFVKSVNKALAVSKGHVALVNTDVEVPSGWLERLMYPIINGKKVASSTPFTNCGTIFSFPNMGLDNTLVAGLDVNQVDNCFKHIVPSYISVPTGVGFCMGMNRNVLNEIGLLDDINFGKGYGEENDWCQRSIKAGYHNVYVENLFVYHNHGGSFPSEEKQRLLELNGKRLLEKHPDYLKDVAKFCEIDPNKNVREYAYFELLSNLVDVTTIVAFDHNWGGGAGAYLEKYKSEKINQDNRFVIVRYDISQSNYLIECAYDKWNVTIRFRETIDLQKYLETWRIDLILVNELVSYPDLYNWLEFFVNIRNSKNCKLRMLLHDYYAICPTINLLDNNHIYCDIPNCAKCEECIRNHSEVFYNDYQTIENWRNSWAGFLMECDEVRVFSQDSKRLLTKAYPSLENIECVPHLSDFSFKIQKKQKKTNTINVGVLGFINEKKGLSILKELLDQSRIRNDNIRLVVIGEIVGEWDNEQIIVTGRYRKEEIPNLVLKYDVDLFLLPSIVPETFSYTTDEIMKMNMPIAVFNIGAPAERVCLYEKGLVINYPQSSERIYEELVAFAKDAVKEYKCVCDRNVLFIADYLSYASRYRVEHLQEQLSFKGINSNFVNADEVRESHVRQCTSIVLYRCKFTQQIHHIVECARQRRIPVYYDIDDYIFEYNKIKSLDFWLDKEYENFENECEKIKQCMKMADVYIVSTEQLKNAVLESFPYAEVHVNRNRASIEMFLLSEKALKNKQKKDDKYVISYFSGSKTHDKDLELISNVLFDILEKYPNVELLLGGCIKIPSVLCKYAKRISSVDFVDWKILPSLIAQSDITLMPLEDTFFHSCKSENKWMEAALVKVPIVASYNDELSKVINNNEDGVLCKTEDEWEAAISKMIEEPQIVRDIATKAYNRVKKEYLTTVLEEDILDLFL